MELVCDSDDNKLTLFCFCTSIGDACDPDADDDGILNDPVSVISWLYFPNTSQILWKSRE